MLKLYCLKCKEYQDRVKRTDTQTEIQKYKNTGFCYEGILETIKEEMKRECLKCGSRLKASNSNN